MTPTMYVLGSLEPLFAGVGVIVGDVLYYGMIGASIMLIAILLLDGALPALHRRRWLPGDGVRKDSLARLRLVTASDTGRRPIPAPPPIRVLP